MDFTRIKSGQIEDGTINLKVYIARLLYMTLNLGRVSYAEDDDLFPSDE